MPKDNNFQHAKYSRGNPGDRVQYKKFEPGASLDSPAWMQAMSRVGLQLTQGKVKGVLFVNGLPYTDLFGAARLDEVGGLKRGYSRGISGLESLLALLRPQSNGLTDEQDALTPPLSNDAAIQERLDALAKEVGNFTTEYVKSFEQGINQQLETPLPCVRFVWSSLHHHVGRVEAAIDLLTYLKEWGSTLSLAQDERLLVFAHGHAGHLLALLSNLLSRGEAELRPRVFEILATYWSGEAQRDQDIGQLEEIFSLLMSGKILNGGELDVVTLGTPVRYGWDVEGVSQLLHIVNHRSIRAEKPWLAKMELPGIAFEMPYLMGGDYVQQLAIAGTDALPDTPQGEQANLEFRELFEPYEGFERWLECTRKTTRCQNDGRCLLVDFDVSFELPVREHLFGHGCYSQSRAMLFTAMETVKTFYS